MITWNRSDVFIFNFRLKISNLILLSTLNMKLPAGKPIQIGFLPWAEIITKNSEISRVVSQEKEYTAVHLVGHEKTMHIFFLVNIGIYLFFVIN